MDSPVLPSRGRSLKSALRPAKQLPLLWRPAVAGVAAAALAAWVTWLAGYQPPEAAQWAYTHGRLQGQHEFDYQLLVIAKVLPAALVAIFVVAGAAFVPRKQTLPTALMAAVVMTASIFLAWGTVGNAWAVGPVMAVVIGIGPLARRHGGAIFAVSQLIAVTYFFFAVMELAKVLDPVGVLVQSGIGAGAAIAVLLVVWLLRVTTGFSLFQRPEPKKDRPKPPKFLAGGVVMRQALLVGALVGSCAGIWVATGNHNYYWILVTFWAITQATPDATFDKGLKRVVGVMAGCLAIGALSQVASPQVVVIVGFAALFAGIVWWMRNYTIYIAAVSMMTVALHGNEHDQSFWHWALLRFADTAIGLVIGFGAYWLVVTLPELMKARREGVQRGAAPPG